MGMATPSRAFCFSSYSSFSALWFASSQEMASSMASSSSFFLSSGILSLTSSEEMDPLSCSSSSRGRSWPRCGCGWRRPRPCTSLPRRPCARSRLGETSLIVGDGDLLLLACGLLDGGDVEDAVGVNVEGDIDLGLATGHGGDTVEIELSEDVVVPGHGALSLEDLDEDAGLVVGVGGEGLGLLGGDGGVALDEGGHDTSRGLEAEGEGGDIEEEELGELLGLVGTGEDGGLDGGAEGDGLVGVDGLARLLSVEEVGEEALDLGDAGGSSDEDDLIDASLGDLGIAQDLLDGVHALLEVVHAQVLETGAGDG